eukprot:gene9485-biopygen7690
MELPWEGRDGAALGRAGRCCPGKGGTGLKGGTVLPWEGRDGAALGVLVCCRNHCRNHSRPCPRERRVCAAPPARTPARPPHGSRVSPGGWSSALASRPAACPHPPTPRCALAHGCDRLPVISPVIITGVLSEGTRQPPGRTPPPPGAPVCACARVRPPAGHHLRRRLVCCAVLTCAAQRCVAQRCAAQLRSTAQRDVARDSSPPVTRTRTYTPSVWCGKRLAAAELPPPPAGAEQKEKNDQPVRTGTYGEPRGTPAHPRARQPVPGWKGSCGCRRNGAARCWSLHDAAARLLATSRRSGTAAGHFMTQRHGCWLLHDAAAPLLVTS